MNYTKEILKHFKLQDKQVWLYSIFRFIDYCFIWDKDMVIIGIQT